MGETVYALKGDIEAYDYQIFGVFDYQIFGVFDTIGKALNAAEDVIAKDFATAEQATEDYGFSGLTISMVRLNATKNPNWDEHSVYWDKENVRAYLKN